MYNNAPKKKVSKEEALLKLSSLCATAEYCEYDLRKKMQRWDMPAGAEDEVIERLTKERFIDEELNYTSNITNGKIFKSVIKEIMKVKIIIK